MAKLRSETRARALRETARSLSDKTFANMARQPAVLHDWERDPSKLPKKPPKPRAPDGARGAEP